MRIAISIAIRAFLLAVMPAAGAQGALPIRNGDAGCGVVCRSATAAGQAAAWRQESTLRGVRTETPAS